MGDNSTENFGTEESRRMIDSADKPMLCCLQLHQSRVGFFVPVDRSLDLPEAGGGGWCARPYASVLSYILVLRWTGWQECVKGRLMFLGFECRQAFCISFLRSLRPPFETGLCTMGYLLPRSLYRLASI